METGELLARFVDYVITPALYLVFAAGFFLFMWGLVQFLWKLDEGASRSEGIQHMIWGVAGMLIMVSFWAILLLVSNTFDLGLQEDGTYEVDLSRLDDVQPFPVR